MLGFLQGTQFRFARLADSVSRVPSFGLHGGQNRLVFGFVLFLGAKAAVVLPVLYPMKTGEIRRNLLKFGDFGKFIFYGTQFRLVVPLVLRNGLLGCLVAQFPAKYACFRKDFEKNRSILNFYENRRNHEKTKGISG